MRAKWTRAQRKARPFDGPHKRLARLLGVDAAEGDLEKAFEACAARVIRANGTTAEQRAAALLQLFEEADASDLNQLGVGRLPWFCTARGLLTATPRDQVAQQEGRRLTVVRALHAAEAGTFAALAEELEPGWFVTQMPAENSSGEDAKIEALKQFAAAKKKAPALAEHAEAFAARLAELGEALSVPRLGRKPSGLYPFALLLRLWPSVPAWEAFKAATLSQLKKEAPEIVTDAIAAARAGDQPLFDYFTNVALHRAEGNKDRAVWFDFDLAAFIEAIKSPHRYYQDTQSRDAAARKVREKLPGRFGDDFQRLQNDVHSQPRFPRQPNALESTLRRNACGGEGQRNAL